MAVLTSKIIICKSVKLDRGHINVLNYTTSQMLTLCNSNGVFVASRDNYSFIRKNGTISVDFTYSQCVQCNYMAFQNPDYDNKWFFAWIDSVEYKGDRNVEISFTVDNWSTWYDLINWLPVFVEREHVNTDSKGEHLLPEPVKCDLVSPQYTLKYLFDKYDIVNHVMLPTGVTPNNVNDRYYATAKANCYSPASAGVASDEIVTETVNGNLVCTTLYPSSFTGKSQDGGSSNPVSLAQNFPNPSNLHGYIPVNNKLFSYPFSYILVDDTSKQILLRYENFDDPWQNQFHEFYIRGYASSVNEISIFPRNYEGVEYNPYYSLTIRDFPMLPTKIDSYLAWLAQKANANILTGMVGIATSAVSGGAIGGAVGTPVGAVAGAGIGAVSAIANYFTAEQTAKDAPDSIKGGDSSSIINIVYGTKGFYIKQIACKAEQARTIDNFFSQNGYSVNTVKIPNITGRQYWNYIKVNGVPVYGAMPEDAIEDITKICNNGVTIWHDHSYLGNYLIGGDSAGRLLNPIV